MDLISTKITLKRQSYHPMETLFYWPKGVVAVLTNAKAYYSYLADFLICMGRHPKNRRTDFWKRYKHDQEGAAITTFFTDCSFSSGNASLISFCEQQKMDGNDYTGTSSLAQANVHFCHFKIIFAGNNNVSSSRTLFYYQKTTILHYHQDFCLHHPHTTNSLTVIV